MSSSVLPREDRARLRRGVAAVLLAALLPATLPPLAWAQTDEERAGARAAADEGLKAFGSGKYSDAVDLFTRAESLVHAPPHLLYIARANAKLGRLVKAREAYIKLKNETIAPDKPKAFHEARASAEKELAALEPRIPSIKVVVAGAGAKTVTVTMDGATVPPALVGIARPVDPGDHKFQATADGMSSGVEVVSIKEGGNETLTLTLKASASGTPAPTASASTTASTPPPAGSATTEPPPKDEGGGGGSGMRIAAYASFGVAVVGVTLGTIWFLGRSSKKDEADRVYRDNGCATGCSDEIKSQIASLDDEWKSKQTLSIVGFAIGGVGAIAGVTLLLLSGHSETKSSAAKPWIAPYVGAGTLGLHGAF